MNAHMHTHMYTPIAHDAVHTLWHSVGPSSCSNYSLWELRLSRTVFLTQVEPCWNTELVTPQTDSNNMLKLPELLIVKHRPSYVCGTGSTDESVSIVGLWLLLTPPVVSLKMPQRCQAHVQARPSSLLAGLACRGRIGGNSLFVAFIDSESVAIAILWRLSTPTVGVNSLGLVLIRGDSSLWALSDGF